MRHGKVYRRMGGGPRERINLLRHFITALVKHERMELSHAKAHETQKYAERLINIAKRGDTDKEAMKIADYWLYDKRQVHKLFKVLAPRFQGWNKDYTQILRVPGFEGEKMIQMAFLEFHGNPYPPLQPIKTKNPNWILNILVRGALDDLKTSAVSISNRNGPITAQKSDTTDIDQLGTAVDNMKLGGSHEGAVDADRMKDETPV